MADPQYLSVAIGSSKSYQLTIYDDTGTLVTGYAAANALSCRIWDGQRQTSLASPAIVWLTPASGTVELTIATADLAALPAVGMYHIEATVLDDSGVPHTILDGILEATDAPGSVTALTSDITYYDIILYAPQIPKLQDIREQAGFITERHRSQSWFKETTLNRYRPQIGRSRRYVNAAGSAAGSILSYAANPAGGDAPSVFNLATYFGRGGLVLTDLIKEAQAHFAASIVYLSQPGRDNPYQQLGQLHAARALSMFDQCVIDLDTATTPSTPPTAVIRVDRDVTYLT